MAAVSLGQDSWPVWWQWDLILTDHMRDSMAQRGLGEVDLRRMLRWASTLEPDPISGRWRVRARQAGINWVVVVEPNPERQWLEAVTVFIPGPRMP